MKKRNFIAKRTFERFLNLHETRVRVRKSGVYESGGSWPRIASLIFCIVLLVSLLWSASLPAMADLTGQSAQVAAPTPGTQLPSKWVTPTASAVVNFSELARLDAARPASAAPPATQVIHSPVTPPDIDAPLPPGTIVPPLRSQPETQLPSGPSPAPALNFAGLDDIADVSSGYMMIPPDTDGAVGLTKIMQGLNNNYRILDKATGATQSTVSPETFWSATGGSGYFDPRMLYDPINNRWIVCMLHGAAAASSSIDIGVSQTSDPAGSYYIYSFDTDGTNTNWADFPNVGFNKNWVAINVNFFSISGGIYANSQVLVVDYTKLLTGTLSGGTWMVGTAFCSAPAATYTSTENTLYVPAHWSSASGTYRLDTITGTPAAPVYTVGSTRSRGLTWTQPSGSILPQAAPLSGTSYCGSTPCPMETQDAQIRSAPVVRDGKIFYAQTVGIPAGGLTHTGAQWTILDGSGGASTGNVVDGGRVEDPTATSSNGGLWYAYPHIAVNNYGDIILGFTQYSSAQYPAAGYTVHKHTDSAGVMNDPQIYKAGEDYYNKTYNSGRNRWGDYGKAQVDPSNDVDLWIVNEYSKARVGTTDTPSSNTSRWGTWWAKVTFGSSEATISSLAAAIQDDGILVQWRTGMEAGNLGFNVYREEESRMTILNSSIVAGSALFAGTDTVLRAGNSYSWLDRDGKANARYWIEDINLAGVSTWHGPVTPGLITTAEAPSISAAAPALLDGMGAGNRNYGSPASQRAVPPSNSAARRSTQFALAAGQAVKIRVRQQGWYRITAEELALVGLGTRTNPRNLHLYVDGQEVPILIRGEQGGLFDGGGGVEFYGIGLDSPSTDLRTYWLVSNAEPGRRLATVQSFGRSSGARSVASTIDIQERSLYMAALNNGEAENFFGPVISATALDQPFSLPQLDTSATGPVTIEVTLQGVTQEQHRVKVMLEDGLLGEMVFAGQAMARGSFAVAPERLKKASGQIRLAAQEGSSDISALERIRITYPHRLTADGGILRFALGAGQKVSIDGFANPSIMVLDITNPDDVFEVSAEATQQKSGFGIQVAAAGRGQRKMMAFTTSQAMKPEIVLANLPSNLGRAGNAADMVIISHGDFMANVEPLRALRTSQGLKTIVVDVEDIYDEFSYGAKTPQAIKDFLQFTRQSWLKSPRYVLLVGDASFDPKDYLHKGNADFVPVKLIDTGNMKTASDDWFVTFEGDSLPQMAVGRLPVRTPEETDRMIARIVQYERSGPQGGGALLISDIGDTYDFKGSNSVLKDIASKSMPVEEIVRGSGEMVVLQQQMIDGINQGKSIVAYMGHGSVDIWRGNFFTSARARELTNAQNLPIVIAVTCLNGYFINPALESMGEAFMRAEHGGAVAVWASTGVSDPQAQADVSIRLLDLLLNSSQADGRPLTIGEAAAIAKWWAKDVDVRRTYVLLGDPAMRVK